MHLEKEVFVVRNSGNIKKIIEKSSKVTPLDGTSKKGSSSYS